MKKTIVMATAIVFVCGCDMLRFAPDQTQKTNAYLHWQVADETARLAGQEQTSETLQSLTALSSRQSRAFMADYGLPKDIPVAKNAEELLSGMANEIAQSAWESSVRRPDVWQLSDGLLELGLSLAGLLGGAYGIKTVQFLRAAQEKAKALKEVVDGNEFFKQLSADSAATFKRAQANQSATTRKLVAELKG